MQSRHFKMSHSDWRQSSLVRTWMAASRSKTAFSRAFLLIFVILPIISFFALIFPLFRSSAYHGHLNRSPLLILRRASSPPVSPFSPLPVSPPPVQHVTQFPIDNTSQTAFDPSVFESIDPRNFL